MRHIEFFAKTRFLCPNAANNAGIAIHAIFSDRGFSGSIKIQIRTLAEQVYDIAASPSLRHLTGIMVDSHDLHYQIVQIVIYIT